jgi:glycosyltransferase involved in cell wall biosynthesis
VGTIDPEEDSKITMTLLFAKKVMIISNSISGGGAEISMMRLFETLKTFDIDLTLCAINQDGTRAIDESGVTVIGRNWGTGIKGTLGGFRNFRLHLRKINPDIVIVNCELPELYTAFSGKLDMRIITVEHTSRPWEGRRFLGFIVRATLLLRRSRWITVSRDQSRIWPFGSNPTFIPNSHFQSERKLELSPVDLVYVGRLNRAKHPEIAAEVAVATSSSIDFFGDGPEIKNLRAKYPASNIRYRGFVENPWAHISPQSILIVASEFEGDGMIIVEAIANGNPVLLADNSDLRRFGFPAENYFRDFNDLVTKVSLTKTQGHNFLQLDSDTKTSFLAERDPIVVAKQWIETIHNL